MGYSVCPYTSPHLLKLNERVRINGRAAADASVGECFEEVEEYRLAAGAPLLTYFEFGTLAALFLFKFEKPEVILLEVGLGGRLDAVNIVDPSIAVITGIDYDHQEWLGDTLEKIGSEKAGIIRRKIPVVIGQNPVPNSVTDRCKSLSCPVFQIGDSFDAEIRAEAASSTTYFRWRQAAGNKASLSVLGQPKLTPSSWASALQVLQIVQDKSLVKSNKLSEDKAKELILTVGLPGRFSQHPGFDNTYFDVAHNAQAAELLSQRLAALQSKGAKIHALFGVLADKDVEAIVRPLVSVIQKWWLADLSSVDRGLSSSQLKDKMPVRLQLQVADGHHLGKLWSQLAASIDENDIIVVFGSFHTVAGVLASKAEA